MPRPQGCASGRLVKLPLAMLALLLAAPARGQSKPTQTPASQPAARESVPAAYGRLSRIPSKRLTREQLALRGVFELTLATGEADGARAARLLGPVGYHALPLEGPLPEKPGKPISRAEFREVVKRRAPLATEDLCAEDLEVLGREALRKQFPAVARWMLPQDLAVVIQPAKQAPPGGWISRECCVVVRLRARKLSIMGGNLLAALARPAAGNEAAKP
jgi:hypothetical protein